MALKTDIYWHPSTRFQVGDLVSCDWLCKGRVTVHRIAFKRTGEQCQTGTLFKVQPPVHPPDKSIDRKIDQGWIDAAWFWVDGLEVL